MAASERIFRLLDEPVTIVSPAKMHALPAPRGEIEFRNVWFAYHGGATPKEEDWVLRDVSFRVEPGQTLAIVGHTGAGKTTIIQLLLRFYDIQRGEILLDGVDIREMDVQDLRQHVRHRAAGSVPLHRHAGIEREARHRHDRSRRQRNARCGKWDSARFSNRCRRAWIRRSRSAARLFPSASGNW